MRRTLFLLFFTHLLTRLIYVHLSGIDNNYSLQSDSHSMVRFADEMLSGNFNFDMGRFIASPLFPVVCGIFKFIFQSQWSLYLVLFQVMLSAVSGLYIYKIAMLLFRDKKLSLFASLLYAFFPMTLWFVHTFSQESLFQSLVIIFIYHLLASLSTAKIKDTILAAVFFSLTFLTKSHLLILSLFIPVIYFHYYGFTRLTFKLVAVFSFISLVFTLPYGLYHYYINGSYVISSNGAAYQFYLGNTEAGFRSIADVPERNTTEFEKISDINNQAGYFNGEQEYNYLLSLPQKLKQKNFYSASIRWISDHPAKFFKLKLYDTLFFLIPGVSFRHYPFKEWLSTFLIYLPIYCLCYLSIYRQCNSSFRNHSWILYLFASMLIFSVVWYVQNRFRTITLEPFYLIYASVYLYKSVDKFPIGHAMINFLDVMFLQFLQGIRVKKILTG